MQTFEPLPPTRAAATINRETNLTPRKPDHAGEKFGEVMDRAMSEPSREVSRDDDKDALAGNSSGGQNSASVSRADHTKNLSKAKKPLHDQSPAEGVAPAAQPIVVNTCATHISQLPKEQTASEEKGTSEETPEVGDGKGKHAGSAEGASKSPGLSTLTVAGSIAISLPSSATQGPVAAAVSKETKGNSSRVLNVSEKAESPGDAPARPDAARAEAKDSTDPGDNASATDAADAHGHAAQPADAASAKADPTDAPPPDLQIAQTPNAKAPVEHPPASVPDPAGTSAAKQDMTMKKTEKTPKVAGPAEQDLPGKAIGSEELPAGQKLSAQVLLHAGQKVESTAAVDSPASARISTPAESVAPAITSAAVAPTTGVDTRLRALERTHDIVALHAMRLTESGSDSLHVVVKPGAGIQLSLELRQTDGGVEVRASLHKGDFEHLNQYWPELQQRLEARGVRVGALTCSENFSDTGHQQFQQPKQQQSPNEDPLHAGAFAEFALAGSMSEAPAARAARATAYRGWETWA